MLWDSRSTKETPILVNEGFLEEERNELNSQGHKSVNKGMYQNKGVALLS